MSLVRTSLLNAIVVVTRVGTALVINKVLAIYVGPAGYAVIGQIQNSISVVASLATVGLANGVTKATAEHFDDADRQVAVWRTAFRLGLVASVVVAILLLLLREALSDVLLLEMGMSSVFIFLALGLPAIAANNLLLAIVNGKKHVSTYVAANVAASLLVLVFTATLTYFFNLFGALVALSISPALTVFSTFLLIRRHEWWRPRTFLGSLDRDALRELGGFALMGVVGAVAMPTALILIRQALADSLGISEAGYWQATWRLSEVYLMLITTTLAVYYLPRIAEIRRATDLRAEIFKVYRFALPVVVVSSIAIFVLRDFIIGVLFTPEFGPMRDLFGWQLAGDTIKISAWVLGYILLGRAMVRSYVIIEIIFSATFYLLTLFFVHLFELQGVAMAYTLNYVIYWAVLAVLVVGELRRMRTREAASDGHDPASDGRGSLE